jgi:hypothetical protein
MPAFEGGEYHYQIRQNTGKNSSTRHYYFTIVLFQLPHAIGDISIREEGFFDRIKSAFGWDDIDFSSSAFSERFHVSAPDRNAAFALIQPRTMDLLMRYNRFDLHIRQPWLMIRSRGSFSLREMERLKRLGEQFLAEIPDFVTEGQGT